MLSPRTSIDLQEQMIYDWINPIYLTSDVQAQIQERFENDSEIELQGFLKVSPQLETMWHQMTTITSCIPCYIARQSDHRCWSLSCSHTC